MPTLPPRRKSTSSSSSSSSPPISSSPSSSSSSSSPSSPPLPSHFRKLGDLGKGAFANVIKVQRIEDDKIYALKQVDVASMKHKEIQDAFNEIRILCTFQKTKPHPRLVRMYETFLTNTKHKTELSIVMEFCACGDLSEKVERYKRKRAYIDERVIWVYLIQIAEGLKGLHQMGILHRDLKAANCFLAEDGSIKIGDMNVSKVTHSRDAKTQIGTPYYMAPEIWLCEPYGEGVDIWSLGCLIFELCSLRPPFLAQSLQELKRNVLRGKYPRIPATYSDELQTVINRLLQTDPRARPSAQAVLEIPEVHSKKGLVKNAMTEEWVPPNNVDPTFLVKKGQEALGTRIPQLPPARYDDEVDDDDEEEEDVDYDERKGSQVNQSANYSNYPSPTTSSSSSSSYSANVNANYERRRSTDRNIPGREEGKEEEKFQEEKFQEDTDDSKRRLSSAKKQQHEHYQHHQNHHHPQPRYSTDSQPRRNSTERTPRRSSIVPVNVKNNDIKRDQRRASVQSAPIPDLSGNLPVDSAHDNNSHNGINGNNRNNSDKGEGQQRERKNSLVDMANNLARGANERLNSIVGRQRGKSVEHSTNSDIQNSDYSSQHQPSPSTSSSAPPRRSSKVSFPSMVSAAGGRRPSVQKNER